MATLLIEMPSGVAGDMLLAGLVALGGDLAQVERDLTLLALGPITLSSKQVDRAGISSIQVDVHAEQKPMWKVAIGNATRSESARHHQAHDALPESPHRQAKQNQQHKHQHRPYRDIRTIIDRVSLPERVRERAQKVFRELAIAEGNVHGVPADDVEFHEVGAVDAIADVVGCCLLLEQLGIDRIVAGPLLPGEGYVTCEHGRMPVPVPAVAEMLARSKAPHRRLPFETGELTTPTGCALVTALSNEFLDRVGDFSVTKTGYGAGHKELPNLANVVRLSIIDERRKAETITEIRCQVDDATGEQLAMLIDELIAAGAKDAHLMPIIMKKGRPGFAITVLCDDHKREAMCSTLLKHSPTIGVRYQQLARDVLPRRSVCVTVQEIPIMLKVVVDPEGRERAKPEADDVAAAARALNLSFAEVQRLALRAYEQGS